MLKLKFKDMNSKSGVIIVGVVALLLALGMGFFAWQNTQLKAEIETMSDTIAVVQQEKSQP